MTMSPRIRFGYGFDMRNPDRWHRPWPDLYAEHLDFITWTETIGFEGVWLAEHHGIDDGYLPSPLVVGAAIAARTKTMRISTGVGLAPHYHPVRLAEDMAVLDQISNGRVELALGIGYLASEAAAYGFARKHRARMSDEILQIVRRLWEGETITFDGECFSISNARVTPPPVQQPSIPLFVGAARQPGLRRAARYGDGFIGGLGHYLLYLDEVRALGKDVGAARFVCMDDMWFLVSEDPDKTFHEVAPHAYYQINMYAEWSADLDYSFPKMDFDTFMRSGILKVLTPEQAIDHVRSKVEATPAEGFCMQAPAGFPLSKLAEHVELFATKVLPAFRLTQPGGNWRRDRLRGHRLLPGPLGARESAGILGLRSRALPGVARAAP
jgi:alkanesulfonate monooxygenase SsuD/methylene tetrahydromethanopterin reductase-like flavin-dependent oxidoreductase (luciferase family)